MLTLECNQSLWLVKLNIIRIGSNVFWISLRFLRRKEVEVFASLARSSSWSPGPVAPAPPVRCCWAAQPESDGTWTSRSVVSRGHMHQGRPSIVNLNPFLPWDPGMCLPHTVEIFWSTPPYTHMTKFLFLSFPWLVSTFLICQKWRKSWVQYSTWVDQHRCPGSL